MIKKMIVGACITIAGIMLFSLVSFADTVSLYANIDDSSSQCNLLVDAMKNDSLYDPYNEFVVLRAGDRDYRIYFGPDLSDQVSFYYIYTPSYQYQAASLSRGMTNGSLTINNNGYYYVGNIEGSLASATAENYKVGVIISVAIIIIVFFVIFRTFRKTEGNKVHYYKVR